jgi:DNA-binding winged helix-turn-helix (wHTH) protein
MVYRFGDCTLDTRRYRMQRSGQPVRLRAKAFYILLHMLERRVSTVLKQELYEHAWLLAFVSEATLESTVRRTIGDSGRPQQLIHTVYGDGYRFVTPVEEWEGVIEVHLGRYTLGVYTMATMTARPDATGGTPSGVRALGACWTPVLWASGMLLPVNGPSYSGRIRGIFGACRAHWCQGAVPAGSQISGGTS